MNSKRLISLFALLLLIIPVYSLNIPTPERDALDRAITDAPMFRQEKKHEIDSLRMLLSKAAFKKHSERTAIALQISESFRTMIPDSSLMYADYAIDFALQSEDSTDLLSARLARAKALATGGLFVASLEEFNRASQMTMSPKTKIDFWKSGRLIYSYMMTYAEGNHAIRSAYEHQYLAYDDSLLRTLPRDDHFYLFIRSERLLRDGDFNEAKRSLEFLLDTISDNMNLYGMAAFQMAEVYRIENEEEMYAAYLAKAAASDIKCCVREGMALPTLAEWLYRQGKLDEAFRYMNFAISDATASNIRMRSVAIAPMMPIIDDAYRNKIRKSQRIRTVSLVLVTLLLIITCVLLVYLHRERVKSIAIQKKLTTLSKLQESYIANFLGLCSTYADRLDTMSKIVGRKLSSGQSDELLKMVNAGKFTEQNDDFYRTVDHAFLDLYPNFIFELNKLLREDAQIAAPEGHTLTPELRIYAFVRLGVEESTKISQILHYSVSTIYAYRNRMRNRAIDRENFEANVLKIGRDS